MSKLDPYPLVACFFLVAGCGDAVPRAAAPPVIPPSPPITTEPQAAPASAPSAAPAAPPSAPPLAELLPPLTRSLVSVVLLKTKTGIIHVPDGSPMRPEWAGLPRAEIISIHGRSPKDIWFLTADQIVLHDDGKRIVDRYVRPCGWDFAQIIVDKDSVRVLGESRGMDTRIGSDVTATLGKRGTWSCGGHGLVPSVATSSGDHTWKLAHNFDSDPCRLRLLDGPCAPAPSWAPSYSEPSDDSTSMGIHYAALWMHGLDDGWIVTWGDDGRQWLHRFNGVAWAPVTTFEKGLRVVDLWADEEGHAWLAVRRGGSSGAPATTVLRFDGHALRPLPVPASFAIWLVRGTGPRDVWFVGAGGKIYQWDGEQLRQGTEPVDASDAWSSPGGEVWMVGKGGVAHTAPLGQVR